ncbi:N-acetyltransferase family protein [Microtetraspora malaysiensis]|uniref:GNAT family N-acetyltransferase n=1 Tax=Microtetraspora malaysiensis TaxID=161358 RepID=UPI003D8A78FB
MTALTVRRAFPEDAALLAEMNRHVHDLHAQHRPDIYNEEPSPQELTTIYREQLGRASVWGFVAELMGSGCVGYATAALHQRAPSAFLQPESFMVLNQLAVAPEATRRGAATALLDAVREAGRAAGCRRLVTEVWDFNDEARSFYEASGFLPMKRSLEQLL